MTLAASGSLSLKSAAGTGRNIQAELGDTGNMTLVEANGLADSWSSCKGTAWNVPTSSPYKITDWYNYNHSYAACDPEGTFISLSCDECGTGDCEIRADGCCGSYCCCCPGGSCT
jgi:hypothetical protein